MKPLEGIKVVDLTTYLAAPTSGRILCEWGAECIKIESDKGDPCRLQGAVFNMPYTDDENLGFDVANMNKKFITLNLKSERGMEVAHKLLSEADVFLTNTRTKSLVKLGLDYDALKQKYPKLIFAQVLGYGENGPEKDTAGFDVTCFMARGGVFGTTVNKGNLPMVPPNGFGDYQVAMYVAAGICGALFNRHRTGEGDKITVSLHHSAVYALSTAMISAQYGNPYPKDRQEVTNPFNNVYKTSDDKWLVLCDPEYDRDFDKVMTLVGREDLAGNTKYNKCADVNKQKLNSEVVGILDAQMKKYTRAQLLEIFKSNDIACEGAYEPLDVYEDEQIWANDILAKIPYPSGARNLPTSPVRFGTVGMPAYHSGGSQGAHSVEIMKSLGYSDKEIQESLDSGAVTGETKLRK